MGRVQQSEVFAAVCEIVQREKILVPAILVEKMIYVYHDIRVDILRIYVYHDILVEKIL